MFETTNQCLICIIFQYWGAQFLTHTQMFLYVTKFKPPTNCAIAYPSIPSVPSHLAAPRPPEATPGSPCMVKVLPLPVWPYLGRDGGTGGVSEEKPRENGRKIGKKRKNG